MEGPDRPDAEVEPGSSAPTAVAVPPAAPPRGPEDGVGSAPGGGDRPGKRSRRLLLALAVVLIAALAGAGAWYGYDQATTRRVALEKVEAATVLIENVDVVVLDVDEVVRAEITPEIGKRSAELKDKVPDAVRDLQRAVRLIDEALEDLDEDDAVRPEALKEAAQARTEMLSVAEPVLDGNERSAAALAPALDGWATVLDAEKLVDDAVVEYNKLTDEAVKKSLGLSNEADKKLHSARDLFSEAATAFPEADFSAYQTYIEGRIASVTFARQADEAFLKGEKARANELSNQYNTKDKELVELAKKLPATPAEVVADAYEKLATEATDAYFAARERATAADEALRALGG